MIVVLELGEVDAAYLVELSRAIRIDPDRLAGNLVRTGLNGARRAGLVEAARAMADPPKGEQPHA